MLQREQEEAYSVYLPSDIKTNTSSMKLSPHHMPPICRPMLIRYRKARAAHISYIAQQSPNAFCSIFGRFGTQKLSLCSCEPNQDGFCEFVMKWIEEHYDWKTDHKFLSAYQHYVNKQTEIFLTDKEIKSRLENKLQILGTKISQECVESLARVIKCYIKHTIYYSKADLLTRENDIYFWLVIGIFYHSGVNSYKQSQTQEAILFWGLDIMMNSLGNLSRKAMERHQSNTTALMERYFEEWVTLLKKKYHIGLQEIVCEWLGEMMCGYIGIEAQGFFIDRLLKVGWNYLYKVVLSFFEKSMEKMEKNQVFTSNADRETVLIMLLGFEDEWPMIFCNASSFCFQKWDDKTKILN